MKKIAAVLMMSLLITGCMTIVDYDAEKAEAVQVGKIKKAQKDPFNNPPTPSYVKVAKDEDKGIYIEVIKLKPITDIHGIKLDVWAVNAVSTSDKAQCISIDWKLQDFEFESEQPLEFLMNGKSVIKLGKMKQSIWSFDGAFIAIPPSGYVDTLNVRDADFDKITHRLTCEIPDEKVDEPKTDHDTLEM